MADPNCTPEEWRIIPFAPLYEVSSRGSIRRTVKGATSGICGRILKPRLHTQGYHTVCLMVDGKPKQFLMHRVVAITFHGDRTAEKLIVCHVDGSKINNTPENLYWGTHKQNTADIVKHGTMRHAKLTDKMVLSIRARHEAGESYNKIAKELGLAQYTVSRASKGVTWAHV